MGFPRGETTIDTKELAQMGSTPTTPLLRLDDNRPSSPASKNFHKLKVYHLSGHALEKVARNVHLDERLLSIGAF